MDEKHTNEGVSGAIYTRWYIDLGNPLLQIQKPVKVVKFGTKKKFQVAHRQVFSQISTETTMFKVEKVKGFVHEYESLYVCMFGTLYDMTEFNTPTAVNVKTYNCRSHLFYTFNSSHSKYQGFYSVRGNKSSKSGRVAGTGLELPPHP